MASVSWAGWTQGGDIGRQLMTYADWSREAARVVNSRKFCELPEETREAFRGILIESENKASLPPRLVTLVDECLASGSMLATPKGMD